MAVTTITIGVGVGWGVVVGYNRDARSHPASATTARATDATVVGLSCLILMIRFSLEVCRAVPHSALQAA